MEKVLVGPVPREVIKNLLREVHAGHLSPIEGQSRLLKWRKVATQKELRSISVASRLIGRWTK